MSSLSAVAAEQERAAAERAEMARRESEPSSLSRQGNWVRLIHKGREHVVCALTVTRVDVTRNRYGEAVTIHQQGLHEWLRLSDLPVNMGVRIRDELLGLDKDAWA